MTDTGESNCRSVFAEVESSGSGDSLTSTSTDLRDSARQIAAFVDRSLRFMSVGITESLSSASEQFLEMTR